MRTPRAAHILSLGGGLTLPLDAITETIAVLGIRGSGKTNTAAVYAEELLAAGQQVVILDPTDAWWGLKSSADGQAPGYPVIVLGGKHADLPLASADGKLVADFVVEQRASVICSLRGFESKQQELAFATAFLRRLYHLKGQEATPTPLALFIDEASRLVPQRVMGEDAACVGAVQQIVRQGRSSGFGVVLIDQRAATVNKDVLAQLEMLVVHRTTGPQDRKALREWIAAHDTEGHEEAFLASLASLQQGEAWFWSPGWLGLFVKQQVRKRRTFDSSRTPRAGEVVVQPQQVAAVDLEALRGKLTATIEKAKADDPKELRKKIVALEKQIAAGPAQERIVERAVVDERAVRRAVADAVKPFEAKLREVARYVPSFHRLIGALGDQFDGLQRAVGASVETPPAPVRAAVAARRAEIATQPARAPVDGVSRGQQKILNALAELELLGVSAPSRYQLGMVAGYNLTGGSGAQHVADLGKLGLLEVGDGVVSITEAGRAAADTDGVPTTLAELHERVLRKIGSGPRKIAEFLISIYPESVSRAALGEATNYNLTGGSGAQHVADLVTVGAAEIPAKGAVRASSLLFPEGLS